ncbi:hypothetical protein ANANG_G00069410 [Anguilla anguilla]|uniref:Nudix hydrolase domain-containing protein n=1 Tax=Anguilla anguilla TaxID=7936 RepID=A0A9D3MQF3_ANGAN|nr:hypothetical protein ANANG_G00069410 [Anguilla anguilla]
MRSTRNTVHSERHRVTCRLGETRTTPPKQRNKLFQLPQRQAGDVPTGTERNGESRTRPPDPAARPHLLQRLPGHQLVQGVGALMRRGAAEFGDPHALLAQPLGVGGVLRTADGLLVLLRRSQRVAEAAGLLDIPGGHPEPKAVCQGVSEDSIQVEQLTESAVVRELFSSICMEIRDEVNIPLSTLSEPVLLGIALNHTSAGRPSAEFYISCSLSSEEVKKFYWQGGPEAHESTDIVFLSEEEMMQLDDCAPLWKELCPSAKGAVMLYRLVLPDILNVSTDK